ncbi:MAG: hypothetical protein AAB250_07660 [Bdellovibrionota bacterium]
MMRHLSFAIIVLASALGFAGRANAYVELNAFYFSDAMTAAASTTNNRMNIEVSVGFAVDKRNQYLVGWGYHMMTASDGATTTATYSSTQMGPRFIYSIDKNNEWTLGLAYYLVTTAAYDDGAGTSVTWKGTALKFDFGYNFPNSGDLDIGIRMNYSSASYVEQLVGSSTYSVVAYTRTSMYPSIYTIYYF